MGREQNGALARRDSVFVPGQHPDEARPVPGGGTVIDIRGPHAVVEHAPPEPGVPEPGAAETGAAETAIDASLVRLPRRLARWVVRAFDLAVAIPAIVVTLPVQAVIAAAILLKDGRPVFFAHNRVGRKGEQFPCLKFRTMVPDAEQRLQRMLDADPELKAEFEVSFKLRDDPRITSIGKVLRRTSLDELPQLYNVVQGTMSIVGPRPVTTAEIGGYGPYLEQVVAVKPGLTGPWQVSGRSDLPREEKIALDIDYARERNLRDDVRICVKTAAVIFQRNNGAY